MNILNFPKAIFNKSYLSIPILGKNYKLNIKYSLLPNLEVIKRDFEIDIIIPKKLKNSDNTKIISLAIKKLYEDIANIKLEESLELARHILKFAPCDYKISRLKNNYYKCTKDKTLIINPDIVRFNKEIIDTTILQAFCKLQFKLNTYKYNCALQNALKKYEAYKASYNINISTQKVS